MRNIKNCRYRCNVCMVNDYEMLVNAVDTSVQQCSFDRN